MLPLKYLNKDDDLVRSRFPLSEPLCVLTTRTPRGITVSVGRVTGRPTTTITKAVDFSLGPPTK